MVRRLHCAADEFPALAAAGGLSAPASAHLPVRDRVPLGADADFTEKRDQSETAPVLRRLYSPDRPVQWVPGLALNPED